MDIILLDRSRDASVIAQLFPEEVRQTSTEFFAAAKGEEIRGVASLGYEEDTVLLRYLFVPEQYRRSGVATAILNDISDRLAFVTDSFLEAYFDRADDYDGLLELFRGRNDFLLDEEEDFCVALWNGVLPDALYA